MKSAHLLLPFAVAGITLSHALADDSAATPGPLHLENTVLVAHDDTINLYNVPTSGPNAKSYDIEIHLAINPDGTLTLTNGKATPTQVLPISLDHFVPGEYHCVSGHTFDLNVTGPVNSPGGRHIWTYISNSQSAAFLVGGTWITGPAIGHPDLVNVDPNITFPKGYTIGESTNGDLILVQQMGDKLIIGMPNKSQNPTNQTPQYTLDSYFILQKKPASAN